MRFALALVIALVLNACANLLMKIGMATIHSSGGLLKDGPIAAVRTVLCSYPLLVGLACFGLNAVLYMYALQSRVLQISIAYPIMVGGGYALIAGIAHIHPSLRENLTMGQKVGVAFVLAGVVIIAVFTSERSQ